MILHASIHYTKCIPLAQLEIGLTSNGVPISPLALHSMYITIPDGIQCPIQFTKLPYTS